LNGQSSTVVWFCGLPGSGKTTIAQGVFDKIKQRRESTSRVKLVSMDSIRKKIFPEPTYSDQERDAAYRSFVLIGSLLSTSGVSVLLDGVGHRKVWRDLARHECSKFVEVYVKCPIEICIQRETNRALTSDEVRGRLYLDALERLRSGKKIEGLGKVPGVDEPFEESESPEVVIDSSKEPADVLIDQAYFALNAYDPGVF
jgi:adenylylsulfate kinase-like enzyme